VAAVYELYFSYGLTKAQSRNEGKHVIFGWIVEFQFILSMAITYEMVSHFVDGFLSGLSEEVVLVCSRTTPASRNRLRRRVTRWGIRGRHLPFVSEWKDSSAMASSKGSACRRRERASCNRRSGSGVDACRLDAGLSVR
jgi:hypothetical protein